MSLKFNELNNEERAVIEDKGTEMPFSGKFENFDEVGVYVCRKCNAYLYRSEDKFDSGCGWPSFDDEINGAIKKQVDSDGKRTEIICNRCNAHLGHVFEGEHLTDKNIRHCVNSVSMDFVQSHNIIREMKIYLGGGCFWCLEPALKMIGGVKDVIVGYMGGTKENPTYDEVCSGNTGHAEVVMVKYDPVEVSLEKILENFFLIHDPTLLNRQGNDIGTQYRSVVYTENDEDLDVVKNYIEKIKDNYGSSIVTEVLSKKEMTAKGFLADFYKAEDYHQDYFNKNNQAPYCQLVIAPKIKKLKL